MSEVQSRPVPTRGRGSGRGGRGGFSTRGGGRPGNRSSNTNGDSKLDSESAVPSIEDEGEVGELKKKYGAKIGMIKEVFPDWTEVDILYAIQECDGDENIAITRIADGNITRWGEVSKQKKAPKAKGKNDTFTTTTGESGPGNARAGRGGRSVPEGGRGGRGRATERGGRGTARGKSAHATTNGTRGAGKENVPLSVPTEESSAWDNPAPGDEATAGWGDEETPATTESAPAAAPAKTAPVSAPTVSTTSIIPDGTRKTWASMLRQSTAPKPAPKPKEVAAPAPPEPTIEPLPPAEPIPDEPESAPAEPIPDEPESAPAAHEEPAPEPVNNHEPVAEPARVVVPEIALPPPKDQLTETNLEQIGDDAITGPDTDTVKSEAASSYDPRAAAASATATPISASQQQHQARAPASGFQATALKATERAAIRTPSFQRRVLDQEEAVRMPGNRDQVERAALQFGSLSLDEEDIDGDREEPETRGQLPDDSPVTQPRTSLPPSQPAPVPDTFAQKPAAVQPPTAPAGMATAPPSAPTQPAAAAQGVPPTSAHAAQYGRYGQPVPQEPASYSQKPFEPFGQPQQGAAAQNQYEGSLPNAPPTTQPQQQPAQQQQPGGAFSSAPSDYSSYYTADPQNRNAYNTYYGQGYGQQHGSQAQPDSGAQQQAPQRSYNGYSAPQNDSLSQYPQSHSASRFGAAAAADVQNSGSNTPNPTGAQVQPAGQNNQSQSHGQQQPGHEYQYGHPYYNNAYYNSYMQNSPYGFNQGSYGGPYGKGNVGYGQPHQYGLQGPHGYGSSPAGGFGQSHLHRSDSGAGAGLDNYGRAGSGGQQGLGSGGFGGMHDSFGRGGSAYQTQAGQGYNAAGSQPGNGPPVDDLKSYDAKGAAGPSPSLGAAARPGSATNTAASQSGLPPPQSGQQVGLSGMGAYGGYGSHMQGHNLHGNQGVSGYGMSGSGSQGHQSGYGGYGSQGFGGSYYGAQTQRGGWGNNYQ